MISTAASEDDHARSEGRRWSRSVGRSQDLRNRGILYGGDYNPEQWSPSTWREDLELMVRAEVNFVTVGVFSWAMLEPEPDHYTFDWLDEVLGGLSANGIAVDLATPTASPPPWMAHRWPETLAVTRDGVRMSTGSRNHFCPTSEIYRDHCRSIVTALVERYQGHPGVAMWHIGNEYGQICHCDSCAQAFRGWLQERYRDLDTLNEAWGTSFWSQRYGDWAEIAPARRAPYLINPTQRLDFRRFGSDALLELFLEQKKIISAGTSGLPITTNFMGFFSLVDYRRWAPHLDVISDDSYPDPTDPDSPADTALTHDLMRSLADGRDWMLMEQAVGAVNWRPHNVPKSSRRVRRDSLQAIARGANGSCFFQWRASRFGSESFHAAMVPHAGADTEVFRGVCAHGKELTRLGSVVHERSRARVAMIFDWPSWWAAEGDAMPSAGIQVLDQLRAWYRPLWRRGVLVDVVSAHDDLTPYDVVLAPQSYLLDEQGVTGFRAYVEQGGSLVLGPFSAVADERGHVRSGRFPVGLTDVFGVSGEAWSPLPEPNVGVELRSTSLGDAPPRIWSERLRLEGGESLATFHGGDLDGLPAITRHRFGSGTATYVGTIPDQDQLTRLLLGVLSAAGVRGPIEELPDGVEAVVRGTALFLLNHSEGERRIVLPETKSVPTGEGRPASGRFHDLLTGTVHETAVILPAGDMCVLMEESR